MTSISLDSISHRFGSTLALDCVSLSIAPGELYFLLGPSGCGKSTLLRIIAGLLTPASGRIRFGDRDVTSVPTQDRSAVMCFQSYALWPHMSVRQNIAFGLEVKGMPVVRLQQRIDEVLRLVRMEALATRKPNELSGGQQQRVALARALAVSPACLLLDEPLSNLDAQLRLEMRSEIRRICKSEGLTTVYVTHDQKEALSIADRIAVLKDGRLMQEGTPSELYYSPASRFVASFIGQTNLIPARIISREQGTLLVDCALGRLRCVAGESSVKMGDEVTLSIRPEHIQPADAGDNRFNARVLHSLFLGESSEHTLAAISGEGSSPIELKSLTAMPLHPSQQALSFCCDPRHVVVLGS